MLYTSPFIRIVTIAKGQKYMCYFVPSYQHYFIDKFTASLLILLVTKTSKDELVKIISQNSAKNIDEINLIIDTLIQKNFLYSSQLSDEEEKLLQKINDLKLMG
ncbi:hypothetical protein [Rickettsia endosymbiont of Gonocerus acuteangulatus]|uniref:hypothetical protein n=1 Tax=Rickettsia endosymbiont of Gonocerus acuteangulatus TaxID=3066266 RepID=UPI003132BA6E